MIDTHVILQNTDIIQLINNDLGPHLKQSGRYSFWNCPFHLDGESPSLGVTPDNGRYYCFGCGASGNVISWMMKYHSINFIGACDQLTNGILIANYKVIKETKPQVNERPLPDEFQDSWREIIEKCEKNLWSDIGSKARDYLHNRGLGTEILRSPFFRVGYSPGVKIAGIWVERGIVIPCFTTTRDLNIDYIHNIKIRRPVGEPKYKLLPGKGCDLSGLFGARLLPGSKIVFMTEGEFDTLILIQEAGDIIGAATLGGATQKFNFSQYGKYLLTVKQIITVYDTDNAGDIGGEYWHGLSRRVKSTKVPKGKDITEYWQLGGNLSDWVLDILSKFGLE